MRLVASCGIRTLFYEERQAQLAQLALESASSGGGGDEEGGEGDGPAPALVQQEVQMPLLEQLKVVGRFRCWGSGEEAAVSSDAAVNLLALQ